MMGDMGDLLDANELLENIELEAADRELEELEQAADRQRRITRIRIDKTD